jgi:peptide subunit release factor 1 (eRF1)
MMEEKDAKGDRERVDALLDAYRANGLAAVGVEDVRAALEIGQVDELVIAGEPDTIEPTGSGATSATPPAVDRSDRSMASEGVSVGPTLEERTADELIVKARQTAATVRIVQDRSLLASVGGVGAFLRFKI